MADKESYQWYKAHKICPRCSMRMADPGKVHCFECLEYSRIYASEHEDKALVSEKQRERRERRKEAGICCKCGKKPVFRYNNHTYAVCYECYIKTSNAQRRHKEKVKKNKKACGICRWCDNPVLEGFYFCAPCLERLRSFALKGSKVAAEGRKQLKQLNYL